MKSIVALTLIFSGIFAQAAGLGRYQEAQAALNKHASNILSVPGVNSIGLAACDSRTGELTRSGDVYCILSTTETQAAADYLGRVYPSGRPLEGVMFWIQVIGKIGPEPRMTVGN